MNHYRIFPLLALAMMLSFGIGQNMAFANTYIRPSVCYAFPTSLHYGATDTSTGGEITSLQNFLASQGYFASANIGTGNFGPLTLKAVMAFQSAQGIPATGLVGPLTRAAIQKISCAAAVTTSPSSVSLTSLSPTALGVGSSLTVSGTGFTSSNTVLFNGNVAAQDVSASPVSNGQTLTFTVPTSLAPFCQANQACPMYVELLTAGQYEVTVENADGTSNKLPLTITTGATTVLH